MTDVDAILARVYAGRVPHAALLDPDGDGAVVYFAQALGGGPIKIGTTARRVRARLDDLQTGRADELRCLGHLPGDAAVERALHREFAPLRLRGEWFHPAAPLLDFIASCCVPPWAGDDPAAPPEPDL
jgi:hypothetical protein